MIIEDELKLCLIKEHCAWFTTQEVTKQDGQEWDSAPYLESFVDAPYQWVPGSGVPYFKIEKVFFETDLVTLDEYALWNEHDPIGHSVYEINEQIKPWLQPLSDSKTKSSVYAGTTLNEFIAIISENGAVYRNVRR